MSSLSLSLSFLITLCGDLMTFPSLGTTNAPQLRESCRGFASLKRGISQTHLFVAVTGSTDCGCVFHRGEPSQTALGDLFCTLRFFDQSQLATAWNSLFPIPQLKGRRYWALLSFPFQVKKGNKRRFLTFSFAGEQLNNPSFVTLSASLPLAHSTSVIHNSQCGLD